MPFKSQAQRRKFAQLLVDGMISDRTFEEWNRETGRRRLPERVAKRATKTRKSTREAAGKRPRKASGTRVRTVARKTPKKPARPRRSPSKRRRAR